MSAMMPTPVLDEAMFGPETAREGELRDAVHRLAAGTCAIVRVPGLLSGDLADLTAQLEQTDFEPYDEQRLDPPILKFGPAVYDYYTQGQVQEAYWEKAELSRKAVREVYGGNDPTAAVLRRLNTEFGIPVRPATVGGRPLHVGILREFTTGSKIHYDEVVREFPGRLDDQPIVQLAFNLHITVADQGGALSVWRHRWVPADDARRDGYGWAPEVVADVPSATALAAAGDGVFFDCRNFHQVQDFKGGRRITLSFFMGFTMNGELIVWS
ncbi:proline hydroxylase [Streptomyces sp. NPDC001544]|uniref:2OG-Fe(II)-dependent halogenase WelO5 family protein n=1 Tax=Streptomyces sp. NPDC001544 TaxID=3364584 RepID=UPI0036A33EE8